MCSQAARTEKTEGQIRLKKGATLQADFETVDLEKAAAAASTEAGAVMECSRSLPMDHM